MRTTAVTMLAAMLATAGVGAQERSPILVTFDLHMDPVSAFPNPDIRRRVVRSWFEAAEWVLSVTEARGAKLSFTTTGDVAEICLADPEHTFPVLERLYRSGGSIGTHSHTWVRQGPMQWVDVSHGATPEQAEQVWRDDVAAVDELVAKLLGIDDPAAIRAVNNLRGSHLPGNAPERHALYQQYGFKIAQAGPGEDFAGLFRHYLWHPFRPSAANELSEDRNSPLVLTQAGPVLGAEAVHKGIEQDMSLPRIQARFLAELLNWLHDAETGQPDRVWCFGWAVHGSDVTMRGVSRPWVEPALEWFDRYFIGKTIGGRIVARYGSYREEAEAYEAWEQTHPDLPSRSYPTLERDWMIYPWLAPVAAYLWDAVYQEAVRSDDQVQVHRLMAPETLDGPYPIVVAFPVGGQTVKVDLSKVDAGSWSRVDPASGKLTEFPAAAVEVPKAGCILIPAASCASFEEQTRLSTAPSGGGCRGQAPGPVAPAVSAT